MGRQRRRLRKGRKAFRLRGRRRCGMRGLMPCRTFFFSTIFFRLKVLFSFVQPSSHIILCLYAKRLTQRDLLIGTHEIMTPVESESSSSVHYRILVHVTNGTSHM